jgi:hypothetical protein
VISAPGNHDTPVLSPALPEWSRRFDRYERYMEGMDIVGQIRNFGDGTGKSFRHQFRAWFSGSDELG